MDGDDGGPALVPREVTIIPVTDAPEFPSTREKEPLDILEDVATLHYLEKGVHLPGMSRCVHRRSQRHAKSYVW